MNKIQQPERTKIVVFHTINWKGNKAIIKGSHEGALYSSKGKMKFSISMTMDGCYSTHCITIGIGSKTKLKTILNSLIESCEKDKREYAERKNFNSLKTSAITLFDKISHPNFKYARLQNNGLGNYYNIYWYNSASPTGVCLVGSCSEEEWEKLSKETGNHHNYLLPTEGYK